MNNRIVKNSAILTLASILASGYLRKIDEEQLADDAFKVALILGGTGSEAFKYREQALLYGTASQDALRYRKSYGGDNFLITDKQYDIMMDLYHIMRQWGSELDLDKCLDRDIGDETNFWTHHT